LLGVVRRLSLIPAVDRPSLADEKNDSVLGQNCDMIRTPAVKGVAAVNFLQLLLVSRRGLLTFTNTGTCWRSLTTVRRIGGVITN